MTCASYRNPALLAKIAASLDHISGGRLKFGIGSGSLLEEFGEYGVSLDKPKERIRRLEEAIQIINKMWVEEEASFSGKYYAIDHAVCNPKPVQKPHPRIIVGGGGEKFTLRVVARFADVWNCAGLLSDYANKLESLKRHCREVDRDFEEIKLSWMVYVILSSDRKEIAKSLPLVPEDLDYVINRHLIGNTDQCIKKMHDFIELGVTDFELVFPDTFFTRKDTVGLPSLETMKRFAELVSPEFK